MNRLEELREMMEGQTGDMLKADLGGLSQFKGVKSWDVLGDAVKSLMLTTSTFSGALGAFVRLLSSGRKLPATTRSLVQSGLQTSRYGADRVAGILAGDELLEPIEMTGRQLLNSRVLRTREDEKEAEAYPRRRITIWTLGENAKDLAAVFSKNGVRLGEVTLPPFVGKWHAVTSEARD